MPRGKPGHDDTVGQPRRASDSRPRPGSGTPKVKSPTGESSPKAHSPQDERKPSESSSALDPGRPTKGDS